MPSKWISKTILTNQRIQTNNYIILNSGKLFHALSLLFNISPFAIRSKSPDNSFKSVFGSLHSACFYVAFRFEACKIWYSVLVCVISPITPRELFAILCRSGTVAFIYLFTWEGLYESRIFREPLLQDAVLSRGFTMCNWLYPKYLSPAFTCLCWVMWDSKGKFEVSSHQSDHKQLHLNYVGL